MKNFVPIIFTLFMSLSSLRTQTVEIVRDTYWIPHIIGDTPRESAYGLAQAYCEDWPEAAIDNILEVRGRLAEAFGKSFLNKDKVTRAFGIYSTADAAFSQLPPDIAAYFEGFALGCTDYFTRHPEALPQSVQNIDILPITGVDAYALGSLYALSRQFGLFKKESGLSSKIEDASNQWAIAPFRTRDHAGYLLCDPHLPFGEFGGSYEAHLISKDGLLDFEGSFIGPYAVMGHNQHVAWSFTSNSPDFADAYVVTLDPAHSSRYLLDGQSKPFTVWQEIIWIAGESPDTVIFRKSSDHGVVMQSVDGQHVLSAKLDILNAPPIGEQMFRMMTASSISEFRAAVSLHQFSKRNTVALDDQGNIFYVYCGRAHYRTDPIAARTAPLDGSVSSTLWGDLIPFDTLPTVTNPESGYLQNCNDAPWYVTTNPGFGQNDVPAELFYGDKFWIRGKRATELIGLGADTMDADYLKKVALDLKVVQWDSIDTVLRQALQESAADSFENQQLAESLADTLFKWNGRAETNSDAMSLFYLWYYSLKDDIDFLEPGGINADQRRLMVEKLVQAPNQLIELYGSATIPWGAIHGFERNGVWFPISGDKELQTARMGGWKNKDAKNRLLVNQGNYYMMIIRLKSGEVPTAWTMKPFGQSSDPASPHYNDLTTLYSADSLRKTWYEESAFRAHAEQIEKFDLTAIKKKDDDIGNNLKYTFELEPNYPNPFNPQTTIQYSIPVSGHVRLHIFNVFGQEIRTLVDAKQSAGRHSVIWNGQNNFGERVASGIYFLRLEAHNFARTRKIILLD